MRRLLLCTLCALWACDDASTTVPSDLGRDGAPTDATVDARPLDVGPLDAAPPDAEARDAAPRDALLVDATPDALPLDAALDLGPLDAGPPPHPLRINEVMALNQGAWVDTIGEADDFIELINIGENTLNLGGFTLSDDLEDPHPLPDIELGPGATLLLWADRSPGQGPLHLPFSLSSGGETLYLHTPRGSLIDTFQFPASAENDSFQRYPDGMGSPVRCRWATADRSNGDRCGPPPPPEIPELVEYAPYVWAEVWPFPPTPLVITEVALRPAGFVEVHNPTAEVVDLATFALRVAPHPPGLAWPARDAGVLLAWPRGALAPGARIAVPVPVEATMALEADPLFEGALTLWAEGREFPVDRLDFMSWPEGGVLARSPDATGRHRFCAIATPGAANDRCDPLRSRPVGDRLRHLRTPGDYGALAEGGVASGIESVKFVIDMEAGDVVHLAGARRWDLHYTFVREVIEGLPHLDRCDPEQEREHLRGWSAFSRINYSSVEDRRYLLGTLAHHGGPGLHTVEFTPGDRIIAAQMRRAFFGLMGRMIEPRQWFMRPQTGAQVEEMRLIEGQAPLVGPNAPFRGLTYQPLTETEGYGVLTFVPTEALERTILGPEVIVLTDQVPNDIALTGGLITEAFQTPLAHVNLLSRNRDTPNMALADAREDPRVAPLLGQLVHLRVRGGGFDLERADPAAAQAFWEARRPQGPPEEPRLDVEVRGVVPLADRGLEDLPSLGAKAAQLAELAKVVSGREGCAGPIATPDRPVAIPVVHSLEHYAASGALRLLEQLRARPDWADPAVRAAGLHGVRTRILRHPVDAELLALVEGYIAQTWGAGARIRLRSSSNTEDLPGFNGAGLYTSMSAELGDPERAAEDALRVVWASLYNPRAYDERAYHNIAQDGVAMGILVHPAFLSERANGVAISRDVRDPIRADAYINVQKGEATVTNPAPGVSTEQIIYRYRRQPRINYLGRSSLIPDGQGVLSEAEIEGSACVLKAIHDHFLPLLDPAREDPWFAMDIEFKLLGEARSLLVKQARPYSFGSREIPADCREI